MKKRVVLIDAKNLLFRHNAVNGDLCRGDGFPTGALHGCLNSLIALARHLPDTYFVWVWDGAGETWRHKFMRDNSYLYVTRKEQIERIDRREASVREPANLQKRVHGYKANRAPKKIFDLSRKPKSHDARPKYPEDSKARGLFQIPVLRLVLEGCGFRNYEIKTLEGDDLIAIIAQHLVKHTDMEVIIHSGDKDFYQLMSDRVRILTRIEKGKPKFIHRKDLKKKYGVTVENWAKYRAWTGDPSDNIPHIPGIGDSAAAKMVNAGLDPSMELKDIDPKIAKEFVRYFEPDGITQRWAFVQANYSLCKLVTHRKDSRLVPELQKSVKQLLRHLKFKRDKSKITSENYRRVSHLLMSYELKSVLGRRDLLWKIP